MKEKRVKVTITAKNNEKKSFNYETDFEEVHKEVIDWLQSIEDRE